MSNGLSILILMLSALAAMLAGMSVFSNNRPPDGRLNLVMDERHSIYLRNEGIVCGILGDRAHFGRQRNQSEHEAIYSTSYTLAECNLCCLAGNSPDLAFE